MKINVGKRDRFGVKDLFGLINRNRELKGIDIGTIDLNFNYSIFTVNKSIANKVMKALLKSKFNGMNLDISISNSIPNYSRGRSNKRGGRNRGRSNKIGGRNRGRRNNNKN